MLLTAQIIGERLKILRKTSKLTQIELANILKIGGHNITRLERGENVGLDVLIPVLNYFREIYSLETLLANAHFVIRKDQVTENMNVRSIIVHEKLKDIQKSVDDAVSYVAKEISDI